MVQLANAAMPASSTTQVLAIRKRPDLWAEKHSYGGEISWIIKDPVGLEYYRLGEHEYAILEMLDGTASLESLKERFDLRFAPQRIPLQQLHFFLGQLHAMGLVTSPVGDQGAVLLEKRREKDRQQWLTTFSNILAVRFRGVDPEGLLTVLDDVAGWLFTRWAVAGVMLLALAALTLVSVNFDQFHARLPAFNEFFGFGNFGWLFLSLAIAKILHELGHGLSCKRLGGECHEIGLMLLVFAPCLYCNVSDSWMLRNKWHRAAIAAAGMYVEIILASLATFLWWFSVPGLFNNLCLNFMLVCSVSTVMFNGNPLLRYDGYFILADVLEFPNLWERSRQVLRQLASRLCLGIDAYAEATLPRRRRALLAAYALTSTVYRWFVLVMILWFLLEALKPYRLEIIGRLATLFALGTIIGMPLYQAGQFFMVPGRTGDVKKLRVLLSLTVLAAAVAGVLFIPVPHHVTASLVIEPRDAQRIYAVWPGRLQRAFVQPGDRVEAGDPIATLENPDMQMELEALAGRRELQALQLENLKRLDDDPDIAAQIPTATESLHELEKQWTQKRADCAQLALTSPVAGIVMAAPGRPEPRRHDDISLVGWFGMPLDKENTGCVLESGTLVCLVGDPASMEAVLMIDQADVDFVRQGQPVEILLDEMPGNVWQGEISDVAESRLETAPPQLAARYGGEIQTQTDPSGQDRPLDVYYRAHVPLDDSQQRLVNGLRGQAKIRIGTRTLGQWLMRTLSETFHFRL